MMTVKQAQEVIARHVQALPPEIVPLEKAHGRILREPVASPEDLPAFDRSAMDGYAIRETDAANDFVVVGEIRAGESIDRELQPGEAIRMFTGARMPGRGLKVIVQEHVDARGNRIRLLQRDKAAHVRRRGEDARAGDVLLESGKSLDAASIALLASMGKTSLSVSRLPAILHLTTGDEIVPPAQTPKPGQIRNSNAALISALLREQGISSVRHLHSGDDLNEMIQIMSEAQPQTCDMIMISGGSGPGNYDFSGKLLQHLGATVHFREVNVRPGKPLIFGTASSQIVFGLPGNALSHFVCFHLLVRRALDSLLARSAGTVMQGILVESMTETHNARETWWPALARLREGRLECLAQPWKSSGDITRLPSANALLRVPASTPQLPAGTTVELLLTQSLL